MPSRPVAGSPGGPAGWPALRAAVLVVALALTAASVAPGPASEPPDVRASTAAPLVGAFVPRGGHASTASAAAAYEDALGRRLDVQRIYLRWDEPLDSPAVTDAVARGRVPMVSVLPRLLDGTQLTWAQVASGALDERIRAQAAQAAALGPVVYLTLHHEPDAASPAYGTPGQFVAAWRRWVTVLRGAGVTNALWTWVVTPAAVSRPRSDPGAGGFYPGDDVVDRIGADVYNWYGCRPNVPGEWRSLATATAGLREFADARGKPAVLPEWGSVEDPADPQRRAVWLREAFAHLATWPRLEAAAYFDTVGTCDWRLATSPAAWAAYREGVQGLRGRPGAWLVAPTTAVPSGQGVTFDLAASTGTGSAPGTGVTAWTLDHGDGTSTAGTGHPAAPVVHVYAPGTWTATLRVTDATGSTGVDRATVHVAAAPLVVGTTTSGLTSTGVVLQAWVDTGGLPGTARFTWWTDAGEAGATSVALTARRGSQDLRVPVTGLSPGTRHTWSVTAVTQAASSRDGWFHTPGPPAVRSVPAGGVTATTARVDLRVHPQGVATTAWVEHGTVLPGASSPPVDLGPATYERGVQVTLAGLTPGTTYRYRVVAQNAYGRTVGPVQVLTTRP
ncbi:hypothetical protein H9657_17515 [Cellulomonas sp. Sa3CUA2]|uniref:PKD domain-containing protein n=1 Tax=Cellulomonas avistercoris TaxID=2762242 RepID=A0ABR8QI16_9CELL|nr:PKD domain-containing protein [Cellulomonas avistercoris]MBD7920073.1 hypothetical protein [Cellulomonas avistercoris]